MRTLSFDGRWAYSLSAAQVISTQITANYAWGKPPFDLLPSLGGPMMMRGYYTGRYRDQNALAMQIEYSICIARAF